MAIPTINLGSVPNDGTGSTLREGGVIVNLILDMWNTVANGISYPAGNVGIGTTSPAPINTSNAKALMIESTVASEIILSHSDAGSNSVIGSLIFSRMTDSLAAVKSNTDGADDAGKLIFQTQATGGSLLASMTILSGGNVGIGPTSPTEKLEIDGNVKATDFIIA